MEGAATQEASHCLLTAGRSGAAVERVHAAHPGDPAGPDGADPRAVARREKPDERDRQHVLRPALLDLRPMRGLGKTAADIIPADPAIERLRNFACVCLHVRMWP